MTPHRRRPASVVRLSADHMQMKLRHDVADGGKVDFRTTQFLFDELPNERGFAQRVFTLLCQQVEQVRRCDFGYENKPRHGRVSVQQHMAKIESAEPMTISE